MTKKKQTKDVDEKAPVFLSMQKKEYSGGTSNHLEHNANPDYWNILLGDLKEKEKWEDKKALDFACGKGRNVNNLFTSCNWERVDGIDISAANIEHCKEMYKKQKSEWYVNNGQDVSELKDNEYDYIMSTIALQHIPVYNIRKSLFTDLLRALKPKGLFSFQMGFGDGLTDPSGLNRPRSSYFENAYNARGTNSTHDVRVQKEEEIIDDLSQIGYVNITTQVKDSFSDSGHLKWIYVKCYKK